MPPTTHSRLGASSAKRWLNCPGSIKLSEGMPNKSSKYALEGTAAHKLAEECLLNKRSPYTYINGGTVTLEDDDGAQIEYEVTANMAEAVMVYLKEVTAQAAQLGVEINDSNVEVGFHLDWIDEELWGTNDLMIGIPFDTLHIYDYKHGQGIAVDVEENEQLMYYAVGAIGKGNPNNYTDVELCVVQPRASHSDGPVRKWKLSVAELLDWVGVVLAPGVEETRKDNPPFAGGSHCRFCPAISICPEVGKEAAAVARVPAAKVFSGEPVQFPGPSEIGLDQRLAITQFIEQFESWAKAIREDTHERLMRGEAVPGFKLVAGRKSRSWVDGAENQIAQIMGDDAYDKKLKSPAQMETVLKKSNMPANRFEPLVEVSQGKSVALETDKRAALPLLNAAEVFTENN